jgi:predicted AAA+ superfamily ATPase
MENGNNDNLPELLVAESNLEEFLQNNAVFVDKTRIISELINDPRRLFFLSRPRRFGKTLLLDTIKNIFEGKKHLFENLDIGKKELNHVWEPFPVIQLSFNGYGNDTSELKESLLYELNEIAIAHNLPIDKITKISDIRKIITHLSRQQKIDSSDAGFT